jgi:hypothetical protein
VTRVRPQGRAEQGHFDAGEAKARGVVELTVPAATRDLLEERRRLLGARPEDDRSDDKHRELATPHLITSPNLVGDERSPQGQRMEP